MRSWDKCGALKPGKERSLSSKARNHCSLASSGSQIFAPSNIMLGLSKNRHCSRGLSTCSERGHGLRKDPGSSSMLNSPSWPSHAPAHEETSQPREGWLTGLKFKLKQLSQGGSCLQASTVLAKATFPLQSLAPLPQSQARRGWRLGDCRQAVWDVGKFQSSGWRQVPRELAGDPRATLALLPLGMRPDLRKRYLRTGAMV